MMFWLGLEVGLMNLHVECRHRLLAGGVLSMCTVVSTP